MKLSQLGTRLFAANYETVFNCEIAFKDLPALHNERQRKHETPHKCTRRHAGIVYRRRIMRRVIINVHTYLSLITYVAFTNQVTRPLLLGTIRNACNYILRVLPINCVQENLYHAPSLTLFSCLYRV